MLSDIQMLKGPKARALEILVITASPSSSGASDFPQSCHDEAAMLPLWRPKCWGWTHHP